MSQFENPYADPSAVPQAPQTTSKLAIWSLVCSLIICCPITTLLGPLLGLIALGKIGSNPMLKGRGLAVAGILIGLLMTAGIAVGAYLAAPTFDKYFIAPARFTIRGPADALSAGLSGDIAGFKDAFQGDGATATDAEAQAFIDELRNRYGGFVSSQVAQQGAQPTIGQTAFTMPYTVTFDNGTVTAQTEVIIADPATRDLVMKIGSITIEDPDKGDLRYPVVP